MPGLLRSSRYIKVVKEAKAVIRNMDGRSESDRASESVVGRQNKMAITIRLRQVIEQC